MLAYVKILRPANALMSAVAVFIGGLIVTDPILLVEGHQIYAAMLAAFLITGAGNIVNDYLDIESDKINKPKRPLPSRRMGKRAALSYSCTLFIIGIALTLLFDTWYPFMIALINSLLLVAYSTHLQNKVLIGNIAVAYLAGSTFLFGGAAMGNLLLPLILTVLASFANLSREIIKDLEDVEGDKVGFIKTMMSRVVQGLENTGGHGRFNVSEKGVTLKYDEKRAVFTARLSLLFSVLISPIPYIMGLLGIYYMSIVIITDALFLYSIYVMGKDFDSKHFSSISWKLKAGMAFGMLAFVAGIL